MRDKQGKLTFYFPDLDLDVVPGRNPWEIIISTIDLSLIKNSLSGAPQKPECDAPGGP